MTVAFVTADMDNGLRELPDAIAAYARGIEGAIGRGAFYTLVFLLVVAGIGFAPIGLGILLVLMAVVLPAIGVAVALELPSVVRDRFGSE
ncbi:hypothetical protein [Halogeometricum borinquense]|nr:hypothetical protein [Halogeometricum borinquense]